MELLWNKKKIGRYLLTSEDGPHLWERRLAVLPALGGVHGHAWLRRLVKLRTSPI